MQRSNPENTPVSEWFGRLPLLVRTYGAVSDCSQAEEDGGEEPVAAASVGPEIPAAVAAAAVANDQHIVLGKPSCALSGRSREVGVRAGGLLDFVLRFCAFYGLVGSGANLRIPK